MGIPLGEYEACERGDRGHPHQFLTRAAQVFGVEVHELLNRLRPQAQKILLCRSGKGMEVTRMNGITATTACWPTTSWTKHRAFPGGPSRRDARTRKWT